MRESRVEDCRLTPYLTFAEEFIETVLTLRMNKGWSLRELARQAHLDVGFLSKLVRGITLPTAEAARALDQAFGSGDKLLDLATSARTDPLPQLPSVRRFIGRDPQRARLNAVAGQLTAASPSTVILVAGPPGVGKTSLAIRWANDAKGMFDIVLWSDLGGYTGRQGSEAQPADILEDLLRGVGVPPNRTPATDAERLRWLRGYLHKRAAKVLIVLDNARDLAQVKSILPRTPGSLMLITSRQRIIGLAQEARTIHLPLAPMDESDGIQLIGALIGEERAKREPAAVARMVSLCGALPLALTIMGNLIAADGDATVRSHADALAGRGRLHLLDGDEHTIGVRTAFSWSYNAVSAKDARMFRLLGLHPGPRFSAGAAAALAGVSDNEAILTLENLAKAHLVQQLEGGDYWLHDLLQAYAAEKVVAAEQEQEQERLATVIRLSWAPQLHGVIRSERLEGSCDR